MSENEVLVGIGKLPPKPRLRIALAYWPLGIVGIIFAILIALAPSVASGSVNEAINSKLLGSYLIGKPGLTVSGIECKKNLRQVTWTKYSPYCIPAWHGNNGGATSPGVTATTITLSLREPQQSTTGALNSIFPQSATGTEQQAIETEQAYINLFNKNYELYGRHVVLKTYVGQGNLVNEFQGQGQEEAQKDALTAKSLNAFADISLLNSTQLYDQDLANQKIIAIGAVAQPQDWFEQFAPYEYSEGTCTQLSSVVASVFGRAMAGLPAIFAGSPAMQSRIRSFGLIYPDNPSYTECAKTFEQEFTTKYGAKLVRTIAYTLNFAQEGPQALNVIAQMSSAQATTLLCACDPVFPIFLTRDADGQNYHPEWVALSFGDQFSRLAASDQWSHDFSGGILPPPKVDQESYKAYKLSGSNMKNLSPEFSDIYEPLLLFFGALQMAGPDLNPYTFEQGFFDMANSVPGGQFGNWSFGQNQFTPVGTFQIERWDPAAISPTDGLKGTFIACNGGQEYSVNGNGANLLPDHQQLNCPPVPSS